MSRFSSEWLALREPVDIDSRNRDVLSACAESFGKRETLAVCDIGAGTGASLRAFANILPRQQRWTLIDHDEDNLSRAAELLRAWSETSFQKDGALSIKHRDRIIEIETCVHNFSADPSPWPARTELVTASALLDLTSEVWIQDLVKNLSKQKLSILATLNFDGYLNATPKHKFDQDIFAAFKDHQRTDKGFGPAAGPDAPSILRRELEQAGYKIIEGDSPWRMTADTCDLMRETLKGISQAAMDLGSLPQDKVQGWLGSRLSHTDLLTVGHRDIFAWP